MNDCLIFSSYQLKTSFTKVKKQSILGYTFYVFKKEVINNIIKQEKIDDVFIVIKNNKVIKKLKFNYKSNNQWFFYNNYSNNFFR